MNNEEFHLLPPSQKCKIVQDLITETAEEVLPKKTICEPSRSFVSGKISNLHKEFRKAKRKFKHRSYEQNLIALNDARDRLKEEYTKAREKFWKDICQNTNSGELWSTVNKITNKQKHLVIQPLRNPDGSFEFNDNEIANRLRSAHVTKDNIDTSKFDDAWFQEINRKVDSIIAEEKETLIKNHHENRKPLETYNRDFTQHEVEKVIDKLKANTSPGPDGILPTMLKKGKEALIPIITELFQSCWEEGNVPDPWKVDNRVFIPKPDTDPHTEKSLRGLSLNPILGKCMERSVTHNLVCWLEANFRIPDEHYAYRKFRGVTQALLTLICNVRQGFTDNECTVAAMVDLHAAFDTIWRKGLIYKLHEMGIRGRLLLYVDSFLTNRKSKLLVNSHESWAETNIGVPQGSIISPILFVCYIAEMTANIPTSLGFADDLTTWITHINPDIASKALESNLVKLSKWTNKWRLVINKTKTEVICFSKSGSFPVKVTLEGTILNQVKHKRVLGVTTDENLKFTKHIEDTRTRALKTLSSISRMLDETGGMRTELGLQLYNSLVLPVLTYGYPVWSTVTNTQISLLEDVHESALRKLTGAHGGSATNALEVILGVLPFRLQLQEILGKEFFRIMRKPEEAGVRSAVITCALDNSTILNPAKQMRVAVRETSRNINLDNLDPEPKYSVDQLTVDLQMCHLPGWKELGCSHTRTTAQKVLAAKAVCDHLNGLPHTTLPIFTDGSALGNPGPCGGAAVIYLHGTRNDPVSLNQPVSRRSTSFHGEMAAIDIALEYVVQRTNKEFSSVLIHSDCQSAMDSIINQSGIYTKLTAKIMGNVKTLNEYNVAVKFCWVPGHAGIQANEIADIEAKKAAEAAKLLPEDHAEDSVTIKDAQRVLLAELTKIWQRQWNTQTQGRFTHSLIPSVKLKRHKALQKSSGAVLRSADVRLNRLTAGHTLLKAQHLSQSLTRRAGLTVTTQCDCAQSPQDIEHVLLECPLLNPERDKMCESIMEAVLKCKNCPISRLSLTLLLGDDDSTPTSIKVEVRRSLLKFLTATMHKISI